MQYRRAKSPGSSYFFTLVTHNRRPILCEAENIQILRDSFHKVKQNHTFTIDAIVVLPNHLHYNPVHHGLVLSPKDWQYSSFHKYVKMAFMIVIGEAQKFQFLIVLLAWNKQF